MGTPRSAWTIDGGIERAEALWHEGVSAKRIAEAIGNGCTKNAIIGVAHRRNWPKRPSPIGAKVAKPRVIRAHRAGAVTLPMFGRSCAECGRPLGPTQQTYCTQLCRGKYQMAKIAELRPVAPKPPPAPRPEPRPIALLPRGVCQWPTSNGRPWLFCEEVTEPGKPYCGAHCRQAYTVRSVQEAA